MKKYKSHILLILKYFTVSLCVAVFFLILLPFVFVALKQEPPARTDDIINPDKISMPDTIYVFRSAYGVVEILDFEEYVKGVVAGEMPATFEEEALKAQAVAARTYALSKSFRGSPDSHPLAALCDTTHCQVYRSIFELEQLKSDYWFETGWPVIVKAVEDTRGQLMYYEGELVSQALYHSSSGGKTENSEDVFVSAVPYLRSVYSLYESDIHRDEQTVISISTFADALRRAFPSKGIGSVTGSNINILSRSEGGRVEQIQVGNATFTGAEIRRALALRSANFTLNIDGNSITIITSGFGHGVGMSQHGANGMAGEGYDYKQILSHYYSGVEVF